jgi:hypothetical protein
VWMVDVDLSGGLGAGPRRRRSADERRRVVEDHAGGGCFGGSGERIFVVALCRPIALSESGVVRG